MDLANDVNEHMPDYVVQRVAGGLNAQKKSVNGSRILLVGLAYKKNTGDSRESPAMRVAEILHDQGADLLAVDPFVEAHRLPTYIKLVDLDPETTTSVDAIVVLTEHDGLDYSQILESPAFVLDTRRRLDGLRETL